MLNSLKSLFLFGSKASVIAALTYLSIIVSKKAFLGSAMTKHDGKLSVEQIKEGEDVQTEYNELVTRIDKLLTILDKNNDNMKTNVFESITNFMNKYVKVLHADRKQLDTAAATTVEQARTQAILKYLNLLIVKQCYERLLKKYPTDMLESGMLLPLSSYISYQLSCITTESTASVPGINGDDSLATACELLNELFFQITLQKMKNNKKIEKSVLAVINIIPYMFQVGSKQAMFRQTCCNIMSFLSLNNKLLSDEIWNKLAVKCMESEVIETLTDTMYRMSDNTDATSETCMRSCIVTLAFLLDGRSDLIARFQNYLQESLAKEQQAQLYRAWAKHSVEAHELIKVFAVKLLHLSQK